MVEVDEKSFERNLHTALPRVYQLRSQIGWPGPFLTLIVSFEALFPALLLACVGPDRLAVAGSLRCSPASGAARVSGCRLLVVDVWGRRCGGGSREGSRQLSWAQALSSNLFTRSSLLRRLLTPSQSRSHSSLPPTLSPVLVFPLCPHSHHHLAGFSSLYLICSFLRTTFLLFS